MANTTANSKLDSIVQAGSLYKFEPRGIKAYTLADIDSMPTRECYHPENFEYADCSLERGRQVVLAASNHRTAASMLIDMAASLSTGSPWLGHVPVLRQRRCGIVVSRSAGRRAFDFLGLALDEHKANVDTPLWILEVDGGFLENTEAICRFVRLYGIEAIFLGLTSCGGVERRDPDYLGCRGLGAIQDLLCSDDFSLGIAVVAMQVARNSKADPIDLIEDASGYFAGWMKMWMYARQKSGSFHESKRYLGFGSVNRLAIACSCAGPHGNYLIRASALMYHDDDTTSKPCHSVRMLGGWIPGEPLPFKRNK